MIIFIIILITYFKSWSHYHFLCHQVGLDDGFGGIMKGFNQTLKTKGVQQKLGLLSSTHCIPLCLSLSYL